MITKKKTEDQTTVTTPAAPDPTDSIAIELRNAREAKGLSLSDLHKLTGLSRTTLHQYESADRKPGARELVKLCEVLRVSPNRLLLGSESPFLGSGGVLLALVGLAKTNPAKAAVILPVIVPLMSIAVPNEALAGIASIADEILRARDPELFSQLAKLVEELAKVDAKAFNQLPPEQQKQTMVEAFGRTGLPSGPKSA